MSVFNWYQEGHYQAFFIACFGSIFGASLLVLVCWFISRKKWFLSMPFEIAAMVVTFLSFAVYTYYAFNGQAENSSTSAAQMHVILVPALLTSISITLISLAIFASLLHKVVQRNA